MLERGEPAVSRPRPLGEQGDNSAVPQPLECLFHPRGPSRCGDPSDGGDREPSSLSMSRRIPEDSRLGVTPRLYPGPTTPGRPARAPTSAIGQDKFKQVVDDLIEGHARGIDERRVAG